MLRVAQVCLKSAGVCQALHDQCNEKGLGNMTESMTEAQARGLDRGWDAANYADGYGGRVGGSALDTEADSVAQELYADETLSDTFREWYVTGYARYFKGEWQDGTPRDHNRESWKQHALA